MLTCLPCLAIFVCFIGAFFVTPCIYMCTTAISANFGHFYHFCPNLSWHLKMNEVGIIIGQITWLYALFRHLDHFGPFWAPNSNSGIPFLPIFFLQNIGTWDAKSDAMWCLVLYATFLSPRDPISRSKGPNLAVNIHPVRNFEILDPSGLEMCNASFFFFQNF